MYCRDRWTSLTAWTCRTRARFILSICARSVNSWATTVVSCLPDWSTCRSRQLAAEWPVLLSRDYSVSRDWRPKSVCRHVGKRLIASNLFYNMAMPIRWIYSWFQVVNLKFRSSANFPMSTKNLWKNNEEQVSNCILTKKRNILVTPKLQNSQVFVADNSVLIIAQLVFRQKRLTIRLCFSALRQHFCVDALTCDLICRVNASYAAWMWRNYTSCSNTHWLSINYRMTQLFC